jgi:polyisoprenoid-binding protein YceI
MKKLQFPLAVITLISLSAFIGIGASDWKISDNYSVKFTSDGDPSSGVFKGLQGTVQFDEKNLKATKFDVTIDVATINTGNGMQNTHAKSDKWFDAAKYPVIHFTSTEVTKINSNYSAKGMLEIHGVKKEIMIPFAFTQTGKDGVFTGSFEVNRNDYNIGDPNHKAASKIKVELSVPVTQ